MIRENRQRRVLHVFGRMGRDGAQLRTLSLVKRLDPALFEFHFCADSGNEGELDEEIKSLGGFVHYIRMGPAFPVSLERLHRNWRFDVVHSHVHYSSGRVMAWAAALEIPVRIVHFRSTQDGGGDGFLRCLYRSAMRTLIDRNATHILAVSKAAMIASWRSDWESDDRCRVVYNGIDPEEVSAIDDRDAVLEELGIPKSCRLYVHVGRFNRAKNHLRLLDIFRLVAETDGAARLLLVGHGGNNVEIEVRRRVCELGLAERVIFLGSRSDVPRLLKAADALVFPSLWEGLPGAVLEACAIGTPVVASDLASTREISLYFGTVTLVALEEPDQVWADRIVDLPQRADPADAIRTLQASPFEMKCVAREVLDLYSSWSQTS